MDQWNEMPLDYFNSRDACGTRMRLLEQSRHVSWVYKRIWGEDHNGKTNEGKIQKKMSFTGKLVSASITQHNGSFTPAIRH